MSNLTIYRNEKSSKIKGIALFIGIVAICSYTVFLQLQVDALQADNTEVVASLNEAAAEIVLLNSQLESEKSKGVFSKLSDNISETFNSVKEYVTN